MRKLSKKQKKILIDYLNYLTDIQNYFNIRVQLLEKLEKVNDYETLYQDVDRLVSKIQFENNVDDKINYIMEA